jgi:F0F1-type ATP synthase epsilon subunit
MELHIISSESTLMFRVVWVEVNTSVGNFVIQPGHVPTVLLLEPNQAVKFRLDNGKQEAVLIKDGILEVTRTAATVIART